MSVCQSCKLSQVVIQYCANPINADDKRIKEIQIGDHENKIVNFIDNTTMFLKRYYLPQ